MRHGLDGGDADGVGGDELSDTRLAVGIDLEFDALISGRLTGADRLEVPGERLGVRLVQQAHRRELVIELRRHRDPDRGGRQVRAQATGVRRELPFTARFSPDEIAALMGGRESGAMPEEFVVVQGIADLVVLRPGELWVADFKTDDVKEDGIAARVRMYEPQLKLYARALSRIYNRPVTECWLYFLSARKAIGLDVR